MIGYFLCLAVLTPALSLDVFFGVLGKTPRQHDVLAFLSTLLQLFATVTSPFRIAFTLAVFLCASVVESNHLKQGVAFIFARVTELGSRLLLTVRGRPCLCHAR